MKLKFRNMYPFKRVIPINKHCNICKLSKLEIKRTGKTSSFCGTIQHELDIRRYCEYKKDYIIDESDDCDKFTNMFRYYKL